MTSKKTALPPAVDSLQLPLIVKQVKEALLRFHLPLDRSQRVSRDVENVQTTLDQQVDAYLHSILPAVVDASVVSEERELRTRYLTETFWLIDPIDGTINAITGSTDWAISVALVDSQSMQPLVGIVYLPLLNELFVGAAGYGAELNDRPLSVQSPRRNVKGYSTPIISFGVPANIAEVATRMGGTLSKIMHRGWVTRQTGSAAVDICRVARGSWSAFFEYNLMYWDVAAAVVIAREAGCYVALPPRDDYPSEETLSTPRNVLVVSHSPLVKALKEVTAIACE